MNYWLLGLSTYVLVGVAFLFWGPAARLTRLEVRSLRSRNPEQPSWKFLAFALVLGLAIALLWPVLFFVARQHEMVVGRRDVADRMEAVRLAYELLGGVVSLPMVQRIAKQLDDGPMCYSTHELATTTALNLYRSADGNRLVRLAVMQLKARVTVSDWAIQKKVSPLIATTFEESLCKLFSSAD
jgi:hypothetical protein